MKTARCRKTLVLLSGGMLFFTGWLLGQQSAVTQKTVVHAVAWTPREGMTPQDFEEFKKVTEGLVQSIPGMKRVWVGKLLRPLVLGDVTRSYGLLLEFENLDSRQAWSGQPNRVPFAKVWEKVRESATLFDVVGE